MLIADGRVIRKVFAEGLNDVETFLHSSFSNKLMEQGCIVGTRILDASQFPATVHQRNFASGACIILEHPLIFFPTYPAEWPPEMLHAAAKLTLDMVAGYRAEGLGLKDATPHNIMFEGHRPVFVDVLSIEKRNPCDPLWKAQAQFERTFLLPLLANRYFRVSLAQIFLTSRDGMEPEALYAFCSILRRITPPFFSLATLPTLLGSKRMARDASMYAEHHLQDPEKAGFILEYTFKRMRRLLKRAAPDSSSQRSAWSDYETSNSYAVSEADAKYACVENLMHIYTPRTVLDIGCNTGKFSRLAAKSGARVVAIDRDPVVVGRLWNSALKEDLDILPLVVNLACPTPATGWRNGETLPFIKRSEGKFEAVLMLAIVHHLLVTERIPLREILKLAADLTIKLLLIEFVGKDDPMFIGLCKGRQDLFSWYNRDVFESALSEFFKIVNVSSAGVTHRCLYLLEKI
ncbi:MAG: class I SAM-dependent methyltransferase [Desulfuromonadales bacterium]|nr:class I SAM-dependent methyltransferase [Desulfuromonadales bacterium]